MGEYDEINPSRSCQVAEVQHLGENASVRGSDKLHSERFSKLILINSEDVFQFAWNIKAIQWIRFLVQIQRLTKQLLKIQSDLMKNLFILTLALKEGNVVFQSITKTITRVESLA